MGEWRPRRKEKGAGSSKTGGSSVGGGELSVGSGKYRRSRWEREAEHGVWEGLGSNSEGGRS